jgi:hypothetical protein
MTTKKEEYIKKTIGEPITVKEFIEALQKLPKNAKIVGTINDSDDGMTTFDISPEYLCELEDCSVYYIGDYPFSYYTHLIKE